MFIARLVAFWLLLMVAQLKEAEAAPIIANYKELFGLESIQDFCSGRGRLDDLKDLAADIYRRQTGRFYVVSII